MQTVDFLFFMSKLDWSSFTNSPICVSIRLRVFDIPAASALNFIRRFEAIYTNSIRHIDRFPIDVFPYFERFQFHLSTKFMQLIGIICSF